MSKQIQTISFFAFVARVLPLVLLIGMHPAEAKECSAAQPSNPQRHWSYRLIDGRKCWYQGENNLSKLLLRWPGENSAPSAPDDALALDVSPAVKVNRRNVGENPSHRSDPDACCRPQIEELDSFKARWRGLETTVGKN